MHPSINVDVNEYPDFLQFLERIQENIRSGNYFQESEKIFISRSPGRMDLMGGNDDYTGGLVFEATIQEATWVAVQRRQDRMIHILNPQSAALGWNEYIDYKLSDFRHNDEVKPVNEIHRLLQSNKNQEWSSYVVGGIYLLMKDFPGLITHGLSIFIHSDVPIGKGVSSSAALEVASLKAIAAAFGISLNGVDLATKCQWIENTICLSASGVMDQITVVMGERDHFVPLLCQPCIPEQLIHLPEGVSLWGIDSGVRHEVAGIEYEAARAATFMGYQMICRQEGLELKLDENGQLIRWSDPRWNGYLANMSPSEFRSSFELILPENILGEDFTRQFPTHADPYTLVRPEVSYRARACTRYAVEENHRVQLFVDLIKNRNNQITGRTPTLLGELMYQSHVAYSECGLGSSETDIIVDLAREEGVENGLYGAKITGGGAGGTVAVLGQADPAGESAFQRVVERYQEKTGYFPYLFRGSSPGADSFGVLELDPNQLLI